MKDIKILHYRETCIGCNACVLAAPNRWSMNTQDGKSVLKDGIQKGNVTIATVFEDELEDNKKAAEACPMRIIKISGSSGEKSAS